MIKTADQTKYPRQKWSVLYDTQSPIRYTRILRPVEFDLLVEGVPSYENRIKLKIALVTGMRFRELQKLHKHPEWWRKDEDYILIEEIKPKRKENKVYRRYVFLPDVARELLDAFFSMKLRFPTYQTWEESLKRWANRAGLSPLYMNARMTRKTWECWLTFSFPHMRDQILLSQGHTSETSIKHYLNTPFTEEDLIKMKYWVKGWDRIRA
ncbi:hypothetical protein DRP04_00245 [Archaeoglobales archaeon]|jgi:hypothetical protein|nr:MAG: hypothetical protein DRP04_00245 [Archaeoglobales archaeon]